MALTARIAWPFQASCNYRVTSGKLLGVVTHKHSLAIEPVGRRNYNRTRSQSDQFTGQLDTSGFSRKGVSRTELDKIAKAQRAVDVELQQHRTFKNGDVYAPHDLSPEEMKKWNKFRGPTRDAFDTLGINPLDTYKNFAIMSEYMSDMGRIKTRKQTGLRLVNQRRLAKAIRRAIGLGLMPSVHRHPEILYAEARKRMRRGGVGVASLLSSR